MKTSNKKGFTIIEVVLVLAIAGLIFLVVFLAVPALQSGQRDSQRRSDLSRLQTSVENYRSNNKGQLPVFNTAFLNSYLRTAGESFDSPSGNPYVLQNVTGNTFNTAWSTAVQANVYYKLQVKCPPKEGSPFVAAGARDYAVLMPQEGGGIACQNN